MSTQAKARSRDRSSRLRATWAPSACSLPAVRSEDDPEPACRIVAIDVGNCDGDLLPELMLRAAPRPVSHQRRDLLSSRQSFSSLQAANLLRAASGNLGGH